MTDPSFNAAAIGLALAKALEVAQIPHALGGALAFGVWALPRATKDVDLNLFVESAKLADALQVLSQQGVTIDVPAALAVAEAEGLIVCWYGSCRIDLFTPSIPFSWEALRTRVRVNVEGGPAWFLSAEALAFFKLMFFRSKDLVDLERLLSSQPQLDRAYVRRWLVQTMGELDVRTTTWDDLCRRF